MPTITLSFNLGDIEVPLERQDSQTEQPSELKLQFRFNQTTVTCQVHAHITTAQQPPVTFAATQEVTVLDIHEAAPGFKINAITSPSSITLPIPKDATRQAIEGTDPVEWFQVWPEADNRSSPRLDIRLHQITLELEAEG
jgi:hypothetical protein